MIEVIPFSVSMCVYGGDNPEHFRISVESVLNQSVVPNEVIIVVDGPISDALNTVVTYYEKKEIFKIIRLKENQGHGVARRVSFENCTHDIIALMDADDISEPNRFEKQLEVLAQDKELAIVGGNIAEFVESVENIVGYRIVPNQDQEIKEYLKKRCPMNQVTVMFRKECVNSVGGYLDWYCEEDYYLWIRMYLAGMNFANIPDVLVYVRVGKEMYQRRGGIRYFESEYRLQKYMLKHGIINRTVFCTNVCKRLVVQVLVPSKLRGWIFKKFARTMTR